MAQRIRRNVLRTDKGYWVRVPKRPGRANGWLTSVDGKSRFPLWITEVGMGFALNGSTAQSELTRSYFPRSFQQPAILIRGQSFDQQNYRALGEFIREQQLDSVRTGKVMGLTIPQGGKSIAGKQRGPRDGISAEGYALEIQTGAAFGEFVPDWEFTFTVSRSRAGVAGWDPHPGSYQSLKLKSWSEIFATLNKNTGFITDPDNVTPQWLDNLLDAGNTGRGEGLSH